MLLPNRPRPGGRRLTAAVALRSALGRTILGLVCSAAILVGLVGCERAARGADDAAAASFPYEEMMVAELQEAMEAGTLTSRALTQAYLDRIEALDRRGPALRSMIVVNPDALAIADSLDAERRADQVRGPLHGIPVAIKDNIATADRMPTTAGSVALEGVIASRDAFIIERLREEGAVILGKANLSEWANFRSTASSSGWSALGGQVRNPYALDRSPCGSSSGSAVAVAANLAAVAVGTETDGSVVCPAGVNGVVGIKPTLGLVSRTGIIPIAHSQDIAGPMARTVADAAALLNGLVGADAADASTTSARIEPDYTRFLDAGALRHARIGIVRGRGLTGYHAGTDSLLDRAIADLRVAGATVLDSLALPHHNEYSQAEWTILLYEFKHGLNAYLAGLGDASPVRTLQDVIALNEREKDRSMPYFGQEIFLMAHEKGELTEAEYLEAKERARLAGVGIDSIMREHALDALAAPTGSPAWLIDLVLGDHYMGASSAPAAVAGYPNISVPMGYVHDLPVGISFFGTAWSEPTLIGIAYAYEQATRHRQPPAFRQAAPTVSRD